MASLLKTRRGSGGDGDELRLEPLTRLDEAAADWDRLAEQSGNVFSTREWATVWWDHFGDGGELLLAACRSKGGRIVAILPLYRHRSRVLRLARFLGHGAGDQLGPVCSPVDAPAVAGALKRALSTRPWRSHLLLGERLPADQAWSALTGGRVLLREESPVLRIGGRGWEELLTQSSSNLRQQVRRRERKLLRERKLTYRLARDPGALQDDLDILVALHRARWGPRGSTALSGRRESFHREFAPLALERGWLRLWFAEVDGTAVAAWYGFHFAGAEAFYQSGRDPAWDREAVGFVLLAQTIRAAIEDGAREYRFLRGPEPYKHRFADSDPGLETTLVAHGRPARASAAAVSSISRRPAGRRLLRRLAG
jgi:CelD/BcsL family acetyltransferase involved in cellulose biosynthesis